jgi:hypothetical protein
MDRVVLINEVCRCRRILRRFGRVENTLARLTIEDLIKDSILLILPNMIRRLPSLSSHIPRLNFITQRESGSTWKLQGYC